MRKTRATEAKKHTSGIDFTHVIPLEGTCRYQHVWGEPGILEFNFDAVLAVLGGNTNRITNMFIWGCTPQGNEYWSSRHSANYKSGKLTPLTDEDRSFLRFLVSDLPVDEGEDDA